MAPARIPKGRRQQRLVVGGIVAVVGAVLLMAFAVQLVSKSGGNQLGDRFFEFNPTFIAEQIKIAPVSFPDAIERGRDIYIQHLDDDVRKGWYAFETRAPHEAPACQAVWDRVAKHFRDCTGKNYPADGEGLTHYLVVVPLKGSVRVDLMAPIGLAAAPAFAIPAPTTIRR